MRSGVMGELQDAEREGSRVNGEAELAVGE